MGSGRFSVEDTPLDVPLETTLFINKNNATIVAAWDLEAPSFTESTKVVRLRHDYESLGLGGDHRVKVARKDSLPGGKYGAICKLFMGYQDQPREEYIGTGWLIEQDVIATAGHCVCENGALLKYIKVYFGYHGPQSVGTSHCIYRHGTVVAAPSEYIKAPSYVHDVGFVRLNAPLDGIDPIRYVDTPSKDYAKLEVIGFPGELDNGNYLYKHSQHTVIDLSKNKMLLTYKIDTTGGQSGSPVFMNDVTAIGVHVAGGFPNYASTIGEAGNKFDEYILALNVKQGETSHDAKIIPSKAKKPTPGFQLISVQSSRQFSKKRGRHGVSDPKADGESTHAGNRAKKDWDEIDGSTNHNDSSDSTSTSSSQTSADEEERSLPHGPSQGQHTGNDKSSPEKILERLFNPRKQDHKSPGHHKSRELSGRVLNFPEKLRLTESEGPPLSVEDMTAAADKAIAKGDTSTTFFINFPGPVKGKAKKKLQKLKESVQSWQAWSSSVTEGKVQEQIGAGNLSNAPEEDFTRSAYRAQVFDYLFSQSTWFSKNIDQGMVQRIQVKRVDFHSAILSEVLKGFQIPTSVFSALEAVLQTISNGITANKEKRDQKQQYWIMLTRYEFEEITESVQPVIRVISFLVDEKIQRYSTNKASYESVDIELRFHQYQADFIARIYKKVQEKTDQRLIEAGQKLVQLNTTDIPLPANRK